MSLPQVGDIGRRTLNVPEIYISGRDGRNEGTHDLL